MTRMTHLPRTSGLSHKLVMAAICLVLSAAAVLASVASSARAAELRHPDPGTYLEFPYDGGVTTLGVGVIDENGSPYYCIESDTSSGLDRGPVTMVQDSDEARRIAWLIDRYRGRADENLQAAIGFLVHEHFDLRKDTTWQGYKKAVLARYSDIGPLSERLWAEAVANAPVDATVVSTYRQGLREGVVDVNVENGEGDSISGIPYTVVLEGPAVFENGRRAVSGHSGGGPVSHAWKATGSGPVTASVHYDADALERMDSSQDLVRYGGVAERTGTMATFSVRRDFTPSVTTAVESTVVESGGRIVDEVTSGVSGSGSVWVADLPLTATGWYFDGIDVTQRTVEPDPGETASAFLKRLEGLGYAPSAYGQATFTGPDQTVRAQAMREQGGSEPYEAAGDGSLGTWVWAFERDLQSEKAREYVLKDAVSPFLETSESNVNRARVEVESAVDSHAAVVGAELSDTIVVRGFPQDHSTFPGDDVLGIGADEPYARVSVWWAGDPDDAANDGRCRPSGAEAPQEDANHRLIGTWDYPAGNGRVRVGGGAVDVHGNPVSITARTHGWYVFIWAFDGDDRVAPAASAYDDARERVRVEETERPAPELTTQVEPGAVRVDEPFRDTARIVGEVPEGAYVTFSAYEAVPDGVDPGMNGKLIDEARADADPDKTDQTVLSPETRSPKAGLVYWRATLFSEQGDVLATHELGAEGEVVTVSEPPQGAGAPPASSLPVTGANVSTVAAIGVAALATGTAMLLAIRRRGRNR